MAEQKTNSKTLNPAKLAVEKAKKKAKVYLFKRPHRSFRKTARPRQKLGGKPLPAVWRHVVDCVKFVWREKKIMFGIILIYALVSYVAVGGVSQVDFVAMKDAAQNFFSGEDGGLAGTLALFDATVTGVVSPNTTELQQFLGALIAFVFWLAIVWAARMRMAGNVIKIRDALYNCCAPLISSMVLMVIIAVQLLPAAAGIFVFSVAQSSQIIQSGVEFMLFSAVAFLLCLLSLYWVSASLLGLVVVSLPQMYPWKALSSASELVIGQRWSLALRILAMALMVGLVWVLILFPAILLDAWLRFDWLPIVPVVIQLLGAFTLMFCSVYVYKLYRSLL